MDRFNENSKNKFPFIVRFLTNGFWMMVQGVRGNLPKFYFQMVGVMWVLGLFITWCLAEEQILLADSVLLTWVLAYLVVSGLWMMYREKKVENYTNEIRMRVGDLQKVVETMPDGHLLNEEYETKEMQKQWTNEEAYAHYEAVFPRLVTLAQELVPNEHNTIYALKDYVRGRSNMREENEWRFNELVNERRFEKNDVTKAWLDKTAPYFKFAQDNFFEDTIDMIDRLQKERDSNRKGVLGERQVQRYLEGYEDELLPLYGNRFQSNDGSVENDVLLFSERGIFSLEIKNINASGNQKLKITRDGQWFEWRKNEWVKSNNAKIFDQVNRHNLLTEKKLAEEFTNRRDIEVKSIIVIPNDKVEILNESQFEIMRPSQIPAYIRNQPIRLNREQAIKMRTFIEEADMGQGKFPFLDVEQYALEIEKRIAFIVELQTVFGKVIHVQQKYNNACQNRYLEPLMYERHLNRQKGKLVI